MIRLAFLATTTALLVAQGAVDPGTKTAAKGTAARAASVENEIEVIRGYISDLEAARTRLSQELESTRETMRHDLAAIREAAKDSSSALRETINNDRRALQTRLDFLAATSPPVGTVVAFAGTWPPRRGEVAPWTEAELGWIACDGRPLRKADYLLLYRAIGQSHGDGSTNFDGSPIAGHDFNAPDYRGLFLRGLGAGDIEEGKRVARRPGGGRDLWSGRIRTPRRPCRKPSR